MRTMFHRNNKLNENDEFEFNVYDICREILDDYDAESLGWIGSSDIDNFLDRYYPDMSDNDRWWVHDRMEKFVDVDDYRSVEDEDEDDYDEDEDDYDDEDDNDDEHENPFNIKNGILLHYFHNDSNVVIPNDITEIGDGAFFMRQSLTSVTIPDGVTKIGDLAFCGCTSLTSVNIPNGVIWIGRRTFKECSSLTSVTIPDGVTWIGPEAFDGCTSLRSIHIPDSVDTIADNVFANCTNLRSITIPNSVTIIGKGVFANCPSLKYIKCPKHLADRLKSEYPDIEIATTNRTNENVRMKRNSDRSLLESLIRKYGKNGVKRAINEMLYNNHF